MNVFADIPEVISYQGKVTDTGGTPVSDGTYSMQFSIYDSVTAGNLEWDSGSLSVDVSGGVFEVMLGESPQPTLDLAFDDDYWLDVKVDTDVQSPRVKLGSVGYAYIASGLVPGTEIDGDLYITGNVGIGNTAPTSKLDVFDGSINTDSDYRIQEVPVLAASGNVLRVGRDAGINNTATNGTFLGNNAAPNNTGLYNVFVGGAAGYDNIEGTGNTFIGSVCGVNNSTGHSNTFVGRRAGYSCTTADSCIFVGSRAGYNENNSNRLYIEPTNADSSQALIYGQFDNDILVFNAMVGIGTATPGYALQVGENGDGTEARANAWNLLSSKKYKSDITPLEDGEYQSILQQLVETDVVRYHFYRDENKSQHLGIIAEDAPRDIVTRDGEALSLSDYCAFLLAATKAQQEEIEVLKARISELENVKN